MRLKEASGLKEARKERNSIPRAVYNVEKWERAAADVTPHNFDTN